MRNKRNKPAIVIDIGGSVISPELGKIDARIILGLKDIIARERENRRFALVVGGGKICRVYQEIARKNNTEDASLDWLGPFPENQREKMDSRNVLPV